MGGVGPRFADDGAAVTVRPWGPLEEVLAANCESRDNAIRGPGLARTNRQQRLPIGLESAHRQALAQRQRSATPDPSQAAAGKEITNMLELRPHYSPHTSLPFARNGLHFALITLCLIASACGPAALTERSPNVVFILADDLGWRDTGLYGSEFFETPNIDLLAERGMVFSNAYAAAAICSPTRASIMTGLHPARLGITSASGHLQRETLAKGLRPRGSRSQPALAADSVTRLRLEYVTLAEALRAVGYVTGHFGKWHLGREPYDALAQGFDVDIPHTPGPGPSGGYLGPWRFWPDMGADGEHIEDRMAVEATKFMRENRDRPFFLNYWCFSVHAPIQAKPELIEKYRGLAIPDYPQRNPIYGAMVESLDDAVGTLVAAIDELGIADDTIIVFFSDNGGMVHRFNDGVPVTSNAPLRSGKSSIYEGGVREPLVVVWPGQVAPGSKSDEIVQSVDFYPTLLEMTGTPPRHEQAFDGISMVPALRGKTLEREAIFTYIPNYTAATMQRPSTAVRRGDWKLIRFFADGAAQTDRYELYNLRDDVGETNDLAGSNPRLVAELDGLIEAFLRDTEAVVPKPNPAYVEGLDPFPDGPARVEN